MKQSVGTSVFAWDGEEERGRSCLSVTVSGRLWFLPQCVDASSAPLQGQQQTKSGRTRVSLRIVLYVCTISRVCLAHRQQCTSGPQLNANDMTFTITAQGVVACIPHTLDKRKLYSELAWSSDPESSRGQRCFLLYLK